MKVAFRVDASATIGMGHLVRCLALASELRRQQADCAFVLHEGALGFAEQVTLEGHELIRLPEVREPASVNHDGPMLAHSHWLESGWRADAQSSLSALAGSDFDWLIVDHYALDARWERGMRTAARRILAIDDLADRSHACDLLLDQNFGRDAEDYRPLVSPQCELLTGAHYALIRPEFPALREPSLKRRQDPQLKKLLITMGGVDAGNATGLALEALRTCPLPDECEVTVVMGGRAPWLEKVERLAATMPWPTRVLVKPKSMARLMAESDLALGAAGSTSWERCCLGLPTLLLVLAENQESVARSLEEARAVIALPLDDSLGKRMASAIVRIVDDRSILKALAAEACKITDGRGCSRVVAKLTNCIPIDL